MNKKHHEFGKNGIRIRYEKAVVLFLCPEKAMPVIEAGLERNPIIQMGYHDSARPMGKLISGNGLRNAHEITSATGSLSCWSITIHML